MSDNAIEMIKGQAERITSITREKYAVLQSIGAEHGWKLVKFSGRDGGSWDSVTSVMTAKKLQAYLTAFIHGAEVVARRIYPK